VPLVYRYACYIIIYTYTYIILLQLHIIHERARDDVPVCLARTFTETHRLHYYNNIISYINIVIFIVLICIISRAISREIYDHVRAHVPTIITCAQYCISECGVCVRVVCVCARAIRHPVDRYG